MSKFIPLFVATVFIYICVPVYADSINEQLLQAARDGDVIAIQSLLDKGADIETRGRKGNNPLHITAKKGHLKAAKLLIKAGSNVNNISVIGSTPLMSAAYRSHTAIVQALMAAGADIKPTSDNGNTALDLASDHGNTDSVELIEIGDLANAVNIDISKLKGLTAKKFRNVTKRALRGRGWSVIQETDNQIDAQLIRRKRIFKVIVQWNSDHISIRYLPYYGSHSPNYLKYLQQDMKPYL